MNIAIIPARANSKRIPNKNVKDFFGKPVITYTIKTAIKSGLFERIIVSTDSELIKQISIFHGAEVPWLRKAINATDYATTQQVLVEVIQNLQNEGTNPDYICCIYPVAPLVTANDLNLGYEKIQSKKYSSVLPIVKYAHPIWRGLHAKNGRLKKVFENNFTNRTQDLEEVYHDAGQWYWFDPKRLNEGLINENSGYIKISDLRTQDVDNIDDWQLMEIKFKEMKSLTKE